VKLIIETDRFSYSARNAGPLQSGSVPRPHRDPEGRCADDGTAALTHQRPSAGTPQPVPHQAQVPRRLPVCPVASSDRRNAIVLVLAWIVLSATANPVGDFPLNDDWAYGWTAKQLLESGRFAPSDWAATNLLPQALWGGLFGVPFGFSFTALRASTLVVGLVGVLLSYGLLREVEANPPLAMLGALIVVVNPLYFSLSHTFNSDVPSYTLALSSVYFLLRGLNHARPLALAVGVTLGLVAVLNRQSSIVVLAAFGIAWVTKAGFAPRNALIAAGPVAAGMALNALFAGWLDMFAHRPLMYSFQIARLADTLAAGFAVITATYLWNGWATAMYLGASVVPFLLLSRGVSARHRWVTVMLVLVGSAAGTALVQSGVRMPLAGNVLGVSGIGPMTIGDPVILWDATSRARVDAVWIVVTVAAAVGATFLVATLVAAVPAIRSAMSAGERVRAARLVFIGATVMLYVAGTAGVGLPHWYDRYVILLVPLALALAVMVGEPAWRPAVRPATAFAAASVIALAVVTVAITHDYLAWNRARWRALTHLISEAKIQPSRINGGFEFNGWQFGNRIEICMGQHADKGVAVEPSAAAFTCLWSGMPGADHSVSFFRDRGSLVVGAEAFDRWLPWHRGRLYVLRRPD
jgi:hypothetical protein